MHEPTRHEVYISFNTRVGGSGRESWCKSYVCRDATSAKASVHPVFLPTCLRVLILENMI